LGPALAQIREGEITHPTMFRHVRHEQVEQRIDPRSHDRAAAEVFEDLCGLFDAQLLPQFGIGLEQEGTLGLQLRNQRCIQIGLRRGRKQGLLRRVEVEPDLAVADDFVEGIVDEVVVGLVRATGFQAADRVIDFRKRGNEADCLFLELLVGETGDDRRKVLLGELDHFHGRLGVEGGDFGFGKREHFSILYSD